MSLNKLLFITFICICTPNILLSQSKIISTGDKWLYYDKKNPLPENWFSDKKIGTDWQEGSSPLGYGDKIIATTISYGTSVKEKHITTYFKKTFLLEDPYKHLIYLLNVQRDDGIVVYLNGQEIYRNNMPYGKITNTTFASGLIFGDANEAVTHSKLLSPNDFIAGKNVLSASVHQARKSSSDCLFNIELEGSSQSEMIPLLLKEQAIKNLNLELQLQNLNHSQEIAKKNLQLEFIEQSKFNIIISLLIITVLLFFSILFLVRKWREFLSKENLLSATITELKKQNEKKNREMMSSSLNTVNDKQFIREVKKTLEENITNSTQKEELVRVIKKMIRNIEYNLDSGEHWDNLKKHFNAVYSGFVDNLLRRHPLLTDIEIRHCIFIKLHMQTKEIATILHIDPKSVQVSRYRLKKKMKLDEHIDLKNYISSI